MLGFNESGIVSQNSDCFNFSWTYARLWGF